MRNDDRDRYKETSRQRSKRNTEQKLAALIVDEKIPTRGRTMNKEGIELPTTSFLDFKRMSFLTRVNYNTKSKKGGSRSTVLFSFLRNLEFGIWDLEFGIWDLEFGIWDLGFGIWNSIFISAQFIISKYFIFFGILDAADLDSDIDFRATYDTTYYYLLTSCDVDLIGKSRRASSPPFVD